MEILVIIAIVAAVYFFFFSDQKSASIQNALFDVRNNVIDAAICSFGELCQKISAATPPSKHSSMVFRVTVDRKNVSAKLSIDTQETDLQKLIPGCKLANSLGWSMNAHYIEGTVKNIDLPYTWDGYSNITDGIIHNFTDGFPDAIVVNQFDDPVNTGTAGVIFKSN